MKVTILAHGMKIGKILSLRYSTQIEVFGELNDDAVFQILLNLGLAKGRKYQITDDGAGYYMVGQRQKPIAILIKEGHERFGSRIQFAPLKMPTAE